MSNAQSKVKVQHMGKCLLTLWGQGLPVADEPLTGILLGIGCWVVLGQLAWKQRLAASLLVAYVVLVMAVTVLARRPFNEFRILPLFWSYIEILRCHPKVGPDDGV